MPRSPLAALAAAVVCLLCCVPVSAQDSADDPDKPAATVIADSNADPGAAAQATDQQPPFVRKVRTFIQTNPIIQRFSGDGIYPRIGGLSQGSGFAGGAGYRRHLDWVHVDVSGAISTKAYRGIDATLGWIETKHFDVATKLTYRNDTQDDFYGLGMDTTEAMRVDYGLQTIDLSGRASVRFARWIRIGADAGYYIPDVRGGRDDNLRSIESLFNETTAPGVIRQPHFVHDGVFAEIDTRDAHGFPRRGGFYRAMYTLWNDRTLEQFDFRRFDVVGAQFIPVARNDVVALRLGLSYANNAPGDEIPFYLMPYIGGGDTVRSFREFRFRDENAGIFNAELRHSLHPMVQVAAFVDFGKVAHNWQDINPTDLKHAYGFGIRGGTAERTLIRLDVAYGDDGTRVFLKFTPAF